MFEGAKLTSSMFEDAVLMRQPRWRDIGLEHYMESQVRLFYFNQCLAHDCLDRNEVDP